MSKLLVPENRIEGVRLIASLTDDNVKELFAAMASQPAGLYHAGLPAATADVVKSIPSGDVELIVDTLLSMYPAMISRDKHVGAFAAELANSMLGSEGWGGEEVSRLQSNLENLLQAPSISLGAKATNLLFQNERSLISSRVVTDIRPVFGIDNDEIGGALIIHTLKLEFFSDGTETRQVFYISLDTSDIDQMIRNLERAKRKTLKLQALLEAAAVPAIGEDE
jgi:hypothetical protein